MVAAARINPLRWCPLLALALAGCTRHQDTDVISLPCGAGQLVVYERHTRHIPTHSVTEFELHFLEGKKRRVVSKLQRHVSLYLQSEAADDDRLLREASQSPEMQAVSPDRPLWTVWVSPRDFSREDYDRIHRTLADNLHAIDDALARRQPEASSLHYERRPVLVATRYVDYEALRKVYTGPASRQIEVEPVGRVKMQRRTSADSEMLVTGEIGLITGNGTRVLLQPDSMNWSSGRWSIEDLRLCKDGRGRTLLDDFVVTAASDETAYRESSARIDDREAAFHEMTRRYEAAYRHPVLPLSLRVESKGRIVVVGEVDGESIVRTFGYMVEGGRTMLLPPPDAIPKGIAAFVPIPGVPDRRLFVSECRDRDNRSPIDRYQLIVASDESDYRDRLERARTGADRRQSP